ncbi:hypothetical protein BH18ACT16_BH18ACT16_13320 [soil metagenome]
MSATRPFVAEAEGDSEDPWQVLVESTKTGGLVGVGVANMPPKTSGPSLHVHTREDEGAYVIEGELTFVVGNQRFTAGPGTFVWLPRDTPHTFANLGDEPVRAVGSDRSGRPREHVWETSRVFPFPQGTTGPRRYSRYR